MAGFDEDSAKALNNWHSSSLLGLSSLQTVDTEAAGRLSVDSESSVSLARLACLPWKSIFLTGA
jgi:hypothetical protein